MNDGVRALIEAIEQRAVEKAARDAEYLKNIDTFLPALTSLLGDTPEMAEARRGTDPSPILGLAVKALLRLKAENAALQEKIEELPADNASCDCAGTIAGAPQTYDFCGYPITLTPPCGN